MTPATMNNIDLDQLMSTALTSTGCPLDNPHMIPTWAAAPQNQRAMASLSFFIAMITQFNIYKYRNLAIQKLLAFAEMKSDDITTDQARKACNDLVRIDVVKINHVNTILKNTLNIESEPQTAQILQNLIGTHNDSLSDNHNNDQSTENENPDPSIFTNRKERRRNKALTTKLLKNSLKTNKRNPQPNHNDTNRLLSTLNNHHTNPSSLHTPPPNLNFNPEIEKALAATT